LILVFREFIENLDVSTFKYTVNCEVKEYDDSHC
jgi:hypothetical protein